MELLSTEIDAIRILKPKKFEDNRGFFYESYNEGTLKTIVAEEHFVHPLNPPPAGDIFSDLLVWFPPLAGASAVGIK